MDLAGSSRWKLNLSYTNSFEDGVSQRHTLNNVESVCTGSLARGSLRASFDDGSGGNPLTKLAHSYLIEPMHSLETSIDYYTTGIWENSGDERTSKLPFMSSTPWKLIYATLVYLYLIKSLLPRLMQTRSQPPGLNWFVRIHNLAMVVSNMYAFYRGAKILNFGFRCFGCETIQHKDYSAEAVELLHYGWLFFISRIVEWLDTIFFVLRKKQQQVTKLHVFHHSFVPILSWVYLKFHPGYTMAFFPFVNTFVHTIMYSYYFLATFGPAVRPYLWWKKYLTSLQIAQFVMILIQLASIPLSSNERCQYPRGFLYVAFAGAMLFLWLFYSYYLDTYKGRKDCEKRMRTQSKRSDRQNKQREGSSKSLSESIEDTLLGSTDFYSDCAARTDEFSSIAKSKLA